MTKGTHPEKNVLHAESAEAKHLVVTQPEKFEGLLETISLMDKISEHVGESRAGDLGGSGSGSGSGTKQDDNDQTEREKAIASMPKDTPALRKQLSSYIEKEIASLQKQAQRQAHKASKPGAAYRLNEIYSKIRRLNGFLSQIMEASVDVLKRLFIRVFIDKQSI